jgi:hypothetical protein
MKRFAGLVSCAAAAAWMAGCSEQTMAERGLKKLEEGARMEKNGHSNRNSKKAM